MIQQVLRAAATVFFLLVAGMVWAQDQTAPDYKSWEKFAASAQTSINQDTAQISEQDLEDLRATLVTWRDKFNAARDTNASQIKTIRDQIEALGPAPAEGDSEDAAIAKRRSDLNDQLSKLQAPSITATEAATRADGLIRSLDSELRSRSTDKLLRLSPSPLNPVNWASALKVAGQLTGKLYEESKAQLEGTTRFEELRENGPVIAGLVLVALVLLGRGRRWMEDLSQWLLGRSSMRARMVIEMIVSVGQILVPLGGIVLLLQALQISGLFGATWQDFLRVLAGVATVTLFSAWLAGRLFPWNDRQASPFNLLSERRAEGRLLVVSMGFLQALWDPFGHWVVEQAMALTRASVSSATADAASTAATQLDAALAALTLPLQILAGLALFRTGAVLRRHVRNEDKQSVDRAFGDSLILLIGNAVIVVAVVGPLLGAIGYVNAANQLIWPMIKSLFLAGLVLTLQRFVAEVYVVLTKREDDGRDSLVPILMGFVLVLLALPVLALNWGARVEDLSEVWTTFSNGFDMGGVRISPSIFLVLAIVFAIGYAITRGVQAALRSTILPKTNIDKGGQNAILSGIGYIGIFLAALVAISSAGIDLSSLAIVAGALSVGVGFGLQTIVQNFVSGIILLIERPISEGDWIEVGTQMGVVKAISVRSTRIETFDRTEVIVPNADLISGQVTNWTRGNMTGRLIVPVGVAYGTDTRRIEKLLMEIAEDQPTVMMDPAPNVVFVGFGADSLNFEIRMILSDVNFKLRVMSEVNHQIAARFTREGIEIPFAQRDLWLRNPEALSGRYEDRPARWRDTEEEGHSRREAKLKENETPHDLGQPMPGEGFEDADADGGGDAR
ncbi:DUF3772 domain-containing protein [Thioclava litoralis]|uniref:DUF3772 domain-containing protein n=1 Tax=Thioclava litoralis TaxID=3076557 RepID=A0ABZ1DXZ3_9RHOB|nr:DUF3772 domain-containing protein [Thioclava sp. FTW29]